MKKIAFILPLFFVLGGCYPYTEVENMDILTSVYVGAEGEEIRLGGGVANVRSFSDSMAENPVSLLNARGANLEEAVLNLRSSADHELFYGALRAVVLNETYCREDTKTFMRYLDAQPRLRRSTAVFVTDANMQETIGYKAINDFSAGFAADSIITTLFEERQMRYTSIGDIMYAISCGAAGYSIPHITIEDGTMRVDGYALFADGKMIGYTDNPALTAFTTKVAQQHHLTDGVFLHTKVRKKVVDVQSVGDALHVSANFDFAVYSEGDAPVGEEICHLLAEKLRLQTEQALAQSKALGCDFLELYKEAMTKERAGFEMHTWNAKLKNMTYSVQIQVTPV